MMKKLLFVFTLLLSMNSYAQFTVAEDSIHVTLDTNEEDVAAHNFQSTTTPTDTIKWKLLTVEVPAGWENDAFICDAVQCYDSTVNTNQYELKDTKSKPLDVHFLNNQLTGEGKAKLLVWDVNDSINTVHTVTYVVKIIDAPVAIQEIKTIDVSIFPNPVTKYININNVDLSLINKLEIYNVIGKKVFENNQVSETNRIDFNNFEKGVYILKLLGSNNNTYYTQNIIKK